VGSAQPVAVIAKRLGILLGVAVACAALLAWRVPGGARTLGADVRMDAVQTGEVGVAPLSAFVNAASLVPGRTAAGWVTLRDQTGVPLNVRLRALTSSHDLDRLLRVRIAPRRGVPLYDGPLGGLRTRALALAAGQTRALRVEVSLAAGARTGFQGRIVDVTLQVQQARAAR
jgi:hypothetical protein